MTFLVVAVLSLTFFSFQNNQESKLVRLKNGSYQAANVDLKPETIEELVNYKGWLENKQVQQLQEFDMSKYRASKGWKQFAVTQKSDQATVINQEITENKFSKSLYKMGNVKVRNEEEAIGFVDRTMESYLR